MLISTNFVEKANEVGVEVGVVKYGGGWWWGFGGKVVTLG